MIAYCGIDCDACPIHLATIEPDDDKRDTMRSSVSKLLSEKYGSSLTAQDISDCDGCASGRLFSGSARCQIRGCAIARGLQSCTFCQDYACDELLKHFDLYPNAKTRLDSLRTQS